MSEILDANGRPQIANEKPELVQLWEDGFGFPIPVMDGEQLKMMALVPNQGHVPMLPDGAPVWEHDPLVALVWYEVYMMKQELQTEIKAAREGATGQVDESREELLDRIQQLEADRKNDALELQRLRELIEGKGE